MDGFIDLIAGIFNFLYMCASDIIKGVIENPLRLVFLFLFVYPFYHLLFDKSDGSCGGEPDDTDKLNPTAKDK